MTDELLAYLLDDLPDERRLEIERRLQVDPEWRQELERLRQCLGHDDADPSETRPPSKDLVDRTCCLVERVCGRKSDSHAGLSEANEVGPRSRWTLADMTVAAGVFLIGASLIMPAVRQSRDASRRVACQNNLRTLGTALFDYAHLNEQRRLPEIALGENAGAYAVKLAEAGIISREQLAEAIVCPEATLADQVRTRHVTITVPSRDQLERANGKVLIRMWRRMGGSYAYRFGYFDEHGKYCHIEYKGWSHEPLLADAPSFDLAGVRSANHGGYGQNVIYQDLSARYVTEFVAASGCDRKDREPGAVDHLYLNDKNDHAAGIGRDDVVLGRSEYTPLGRLTPVSRSLAAGCSASPVLWIHVTGLNAEK